MHWQRWHRAYDDPASELSRRLSVVQGEIRRALVAAGPGQVRIVSMCAGEGRDVIGAASGSERASDLTALLVELDPVLADRARASAAAAGLHGITVVTGDAADTARYVDAVPADVVVVCGVFGNISDADVEQTIRHLPGFCAPGATVVWTRHRHPPDLTPSIRQWFGEAGFRETAFHAPDDHGFGVGACVYDGPPSPLPTGVRLFTFQ